MALFSKKKIRVEFLEERSGQAVAWSELKSKEIPKSWQYETTVALDDKEWEVVRVSPERLKEIKREGHMQVWVRRPDAGEDREVEIGAEESAENPEMEVAHAHQVEIEEENTGIDTEPEVVHESVELTEEVDEAAAEEETAAIMESVAAASGIELGKKDAEESEVAEVVEENIEPSAEEEIAEELEVVAEPESENTAEESESVEEEAAEPEVPRMEEVIIAHTPPAEGSSASPTVVGALPQTDPEGFRDAPLTIHPAMFREMEWVSVDKKSVVNTEMAEIRRVIEESGFFIEGQRFFNDVHARTEIQEPFEPGTIRVSGLREVFFKDRQDFEGLKIEGHGIVKGGFAFALPSGIILYGVEDHSEVQFLGLTASTHDFPADLLEADIENIINLMESRRFVLIDWVDMVRLSPNADALVAFFRGTPIPE